ncbi:PAS domain-containing protein [Marinobacter sp. CHS3-4]|uniref:PAS domain-containing protein n=1 Tax=Marinobacter sp. CHS3-4 TaxID=3045174 RepID=UPI0024B4E1A6|nr:PAS domain-containing protein [Marinobacter sp. CHS3-4]MDI9245134.1 PAS domain-containing protein [Marinobacter sp. CHS3-4]
MTTNEGLSWAENRAQLRLHAEDLIRGDAEKVTKISGGAMGVEALAVLYRQARTPEFAADALKLLHELQTHQVELDLLLEQLQASETELTEELAHYQALYRLAPAACLVVSRDGRVIESNAAAVALLGCTPEHSEEQTLSQYLAPPGRSDVANLLERLEIPGAVTTCRAWLVGEDSFELSINASLISSRGLIMIVMSPYPAPHTHPARS